METRYFATTIAFGAAAFALFSIIDTGMPAGPVSAYAPTEILPVLGDAPINMIPTDETLMAD